MKRMRRNNILTVREAMILDVYRKYHCVVNMSFKELLRWARNPCSRMASLSRRPIKHNLELLKTPSHKWNMKHVRWANKTIAFISRMKKVSGGRIISSDCPYSKKTISLKNWAFDPNKVNSMRCHKKAKRKKDKISFFGVSMPKNVRMKS